MRSSALIIVAAFAPALRGFLEILFWMFAAFLAHEATSLTESNPGGVGGSREPFSPSVTGRKDGVVMLTQSRRAPAHGSPRRRQLRSMPIDDWMIPGASFRARIIGNSMEPTFHDGNYVIFEVVDVSDAASLIGRDCAFYRIDGKATFKRLANVSRGRLTLVALNNEAFPSPLHVKTIELQLLAVARAIYHPLTACAGRGSPLPAQQNSGAPDTPHAAHLARKSSMRKAIATAA